MKLENNEQIKDRVVSIFDPKDFKIEWRDIPDYSFYQASNIGTIRFINRKNEIKYPKILPAYVDYLGVSVVDDDGVKSSKFIHVLVCSAFHGPAPNNKIGYVSNHIDGNKHNNTPSNLEWCTISENNIHAYKTGLRNDNTPVIVEDIEIGDVLNFYSISEFGRFFDMDYSKAGRIITQYRNGRLFRDRYYISLDMSKNKPRKQNWVKDIKAKDYINNKTYISNESRTLEIISNINRATILYYLRNNNKNLLAGWVFMYSDDDNEFPNYTKEEILLSKDVFDNKTIPKDRRYGITVKDYVDNTIKNYKSIVEVAKELDIVKGTINYLLSFENDKLFKGKVFRYIENKKPWPVYSKEKIEMSIMVKKPEYPSVRVTDLESNTTKLYPSVAEFARQVGENPKSTANWVKCFPERPYKSRWKIVKEFL